MTESGSSGDHPQSSKSRGGRSAARAQGDKASWLALRSVAVRLALGLRSAMATVELFRTFRYTKNMGRNRATGEWACYVMWKDHPPEDNTWLCPEWFTDPARYQSLLHKLLKVHGPRRRAFLCASATPSRLITLQPNSKRPWPPGAVIGVATTLPFVVATSFARILSFLQPKPLLACHELVDSRARDGVTVDR